MSLPSFSRAGHPLGTFTFSQVYVFPVLEDETPNQVIGYSLGGAGMGRRAISVLDYGGNESTITLAWRNLPLVEVYNLRLWLRNGWIRYAVFPFIFTDHTGATFTVRYLNGAFPVQQTAYQLVGNMSILLRIES